ncbi:MAG: hypothetical protein LBI81_01400, partial [Puniceicoccales bacterium]|nr:hypothetical protein [Puniceicoccales bacterium]
MKFLRNSAIILSTAAFFHTEIYCLPNWQLPDFNLICGEGLEYGKSGAGCGDSGGAGIFPRPR